MSNGTEHGKFAPVDTATPAVARAKGYLSPRCAPHETLHLPKL